MRAILHRPSPSMIVALTALVFASTGGAVAAVSASGGPTAKSAKKKPPPDSSTDKKIVKQLAPTLSVKFAKTAGTASTANNATHAKTADSATTASTASNATLAAGQSLKHFSFVVLSGGAHQLFAFGQVKLDMGCAGGLVGVIASNAGTQTAAIESGFISDNPFPAAVHQVNDENFTSGDADTVASGGSGTGQTDVIFANGTETTFDYGFQDNGRTGVGCRFFGRAITG